MFIEWYKVLRAFCLPFAYCCSVSFARAGQLACAGIFWFVELMFRKKETCVLETRSLDWLGYWVDHEGTLLTVEKHVYLNPKNLSME